MSTAIIQGVEATGNVVPARISGAGQVHVQPRNIYPDGMNKMPSGDDKTRKIFVQVTNGTGQCQFVNDDGSTGGGDTHLVVIALNYVWDGANWVRMTQP